MEPATSLRRYMCQRIAKHQLRERISQKQRMFENHSTHRTDKKELKYFTRIVHSLRKKS